MDIKIAIDRTAVIPAPYSKVSNLLEDVPAAIRLFPKLRQLTDIGNGIYLWEMHPIGAKVANIAHEVSFAAKFAVDPAKGLVQWKPVRAHGKDNGNASIEGRWEVKPNGNDTRMNLKVWGEIRAVPVPMMFRIIAPAFVQGKFAALVEHYFTKLGKELGLNEQSFRKMASG